MKTLKITAMILAVFAAFPLLSSCSRSYRKYSATYTDVFDTVTEFTAYCESQDRFDEVSDALHEELLRLHRLYDIYHEYDGVVNLAYINRVCGQTSADAGDEILSLLQTGAEYCRLTDGRLNVFAGSVLSIWHEYRASGDGVPSYAELYEASKHTSYQSVLIEGSSVRFTDKELKIDAGALAKGAASQYAAGLLDSMGISDYALNVGGNVTVSGKKPEGLWKIGIQSPDGDGLFTKVNVSGTSVVTSGDYQRYYEYDGKKYHHIIDLQTLYPADAYSSVTVICKYQTDADALSTALFLMSIEEGERLIEKYGAEALWIKANGEAVRSKGFSEYE
ncbi:MAG: FAD:protein FMN transferase [Clostridia bacterium]|nr:FAD:protein FMN transferase [Clostridia bacterium]